MSGISREHLRDVSQQRGQYVGTEGRFQQIPTSLAAIHENSTATAET